MNFFLSKTKKNRVFINFYSLWKNSKRKNSNNFHNALSHINFRLDKNFNFMKLLVALLRKSQF